MTRQQVIKHFGNIKQASESLGYSRHALFRWKKGIPLRTQQLIEAKTNGVLKAQKRILYTK